MKSGRRSMEWAYCINT